MFRAWCQSIEQKVLPSAVFISQGKNKMREIPILSPIVRTVGQEWNSYPAQYNYYKVAFTSNRSILQSMREGLIALHYTENYHDSKRYPAINAVMAELRGAAQYLCSHHLWGVSEQK